MASNQIEFSLLRRLPETSGLIAAAHERSIVPLAYSPLAQGRLSGKYTTANPPPTGRAFSNYPMDQLEPLLAVMRKIANARNVPVSAVGLNWIMCKGDNKRCYQNHTILILPLYDDHRCYSPCWCKKWCAGEAGEAFRPLQISKYKPC